MEKQKCHVCKGTGKVPKAEYNNTFSHDLIIGQIAEVQVAEMLTEKKIEVKVDLKANKTGNVFIEYMSRGEDSGIATTHSDYYAFMFSEKQTIFIATELLKEKCRKQHKKTGRVTGGDNNTSLGILLPLSELLSE